LTRNEFQRLNDILESTDFLLEMTSAGSATFFGDRFRQLAAERLLEIIGEAANALTSDIRRNYPEIAWDEIIRLRHLLAHHYHRIDPAHIWSIATNEIPTLSEALRDRLSREN
jgi:uncharacterized protein with HEPN domain